MKIDLEIDGTTQYATAYSDGKPVATVQRRRVYERGPIWTAFNTKGEKLFATFLDVSAATLAKRIRHCLLNQQPKENSTMQRFAIGQRLLLHSEHVATVVEYSATSGKYRVTVPGWVQEVSDGHGDKRPAAYWYEANALQFIPGEPKLPIIPLANAPKTNSGASLNDTPTHVVLYYVAARSIDGTIYCGGYDNVNRCATCWAERRRDAAKLSSQAADDVIAAERERNATVELDEQRGGFRKVPVAASK